MKNPFRNWFKKIVAPHVCEYKCVGYCSHYGQISEIRKSLDNPTWYHYPLPAVKSEWLKQGYDYARVFQSHWKCSCGEHQTFFFLQNPFVEANSPSRYTQSNVSISADQYAEMINHNPISLKSSRGTTMTETVNELCAELL